MIQGVADAGSIYIQYSQLEAGSYATSYIPTEGSTTTRLKDEVSKSGLSSEINSVEGTLFVEMAALDDSLTFRYITISDGTDTNRIILRYYTISNKIQCNIIIGGVLDSSLSYDTDITDFHKIAVKWKTNGTSLWVGGLEIITNLTSSTFPVNSLSAINFANTSQSGAFLEAKLKQLHVYKTALSDTKLAELTS